MVLEAAGETQVSPKAFAVAGQLGKKMSALDSKYKIKDKVAAAVGQVFSFASQRMQEAGDANDDGGNVPEYDRQGGRRSNRPPYPSEGRRQERPNYPGGGGGGYSSGNYDSPPQY